MGSQLFSSYFFLTNILFTWLSLNGDLAVQKEWAFLMFLNRMLKRHPETWLMSAPAGFSPTSVFHFDFYFWNICPFDKPKKYSLQYFTSLWFLMWLILSLILWIVYFYFHVETLTFLLLLSKSFSHSNINFHLCCKIFFHLLF